MSRFIPLVLVVAAGVVLPKVVPVIALRTDPPAWAQRWFSAIPAAMLGALTVPMVGQLATSVGGRIWLSSAYVAVFVIIGVIAMTIRRTAVSFAVGLILLAGLHLVTRVH